MGVRFHVDSLFVLEVRVEYFFSNIRNISTYIWGITSHFLETYNSSPAMLASLQNLTEIQKSSNEEILDLATLLND